MESDRFGWRISGSIITLLATIRYSANCSLASASFVRSLGQNYTANNTAPNCSEFAVQLLRTVSPMQTDRAAHNSMMQTGGRICCSRSVTRALRRARARALCADLFRRPQSAVSGAPPAACRWPAGSRRRPEAPAGSRPPLSAPARPPPRPRAPQPESPRGRVHR